VKNLKIAVIFGSHRIGGTNLEIEEMMKTFSGIHEFDFIHLANNKIEGCTSCHQCGKLGKCALPPSDNDHFQEIYEKMINAECIFIITPVYAVIPSRLTALFERLTSVLYDTGIMNTDYNPLLNKKVAIFNYCSNKICDDNEIKLIFDKFVMKNYRFDKSTYNYINQCNNPNEKYKNIIEYVKDILINL
jgi:multimeric flavodoxin WrbA